MCVCVRVCGCKVKHTRTHVRPRAHTSRRCIACLVPARTFDLAVRLGVRETLVHPSCRVSLAPTNLQLGIKPSFMAGRKSSRAIKPNKINGLQKLWPTVPNRKWTLRHYKRSAKGHSIERSTQRPRRHLYDRFSGFTSRLAGVVLVNLLINLARAK